MFTVGTDELRLRLEEKTVTAGNNSRTLTFMYADTLDKAEVLDVNEVATLLRHSTSELLDLFGKVQLFRQVIG